MKGKNNLFKVLGILLLVVIVLSWIIPGGVFSGTAVTVNESVSPVGLWGVFSYIWEYSFLIMSGLFFVVVGGFYGILNKTNVYKKMVTNVTAMVKGKEFWFLMATMVVFALVTALTGATVELFVVIPFFITVILAMNYDKLTAASVTVGGMLVGMIGGIYGESNAIPYMQVLKINDVNFNVTYKVIALVLGLVALGWFVWQYTTKNKLPNKNANKEVEDLLFDKEVKAGKKVWPLAVVFGLVAVLTIVGTAYTWSALKLEFFNDMHKAVIEYKLNGFTLFANLLGPVVAFGTWSLQDVMIILVIASVILVMAYKIKWAEAFAAFAEYAKKMVPLTLLVWVVSTILLIVFQHPFYLTVMDWMTGMFKDFNIIVVALTSALNTTLFSEGMYAAQFSLPVLGAIYAKSEAMLSLSGQFFNGLTLFVAPTSIMLITTLYYLDIPYVNWLKYIWRLVVILLAVVAAVLLLLQYKVF